MHAAIIARTGLNAAAPSQAPAMRWAQTASSAQPRAGWNWAKAIGADEGSHQAPKTPTVVAKVDDGEAGQVQVAKAVVPAAVVNKPAGLTVQTSVAVVSKKPTSVAGDRTGKVDESKHKADATEDDVAAAANSPQNPAEATVIAAPAVPVQVSVMPVVAKVAEEDKGKEKTGAGASKRATAASGTASSTATADPSTSTDSKAAQTPIQAGQKTDATETVKSKSVETIADVAQVGNHTSNSAATSSATTAVEEVAAAAHKHMPAFAMQLSNESKSVAPIAAAVELNTAHAIAAGPGQLEVGVLDGTHGWLSIRTEMGDNGAVNALLTSGATAHDSLRESVPAMAGYLAAEQLNMGQIAVIQLNRDAGNSSFAGSDLAQSGQGANSRQDRNHNGDASAARAAVDDNSSVATGAVTGISAALFGGSAPVFRGDGIGSWLSVTA